MALRNVWKGGGMFREALLSLQFDLFGGLLAGSLIYSVVSTIIRSPWLMMVYPVVLTSRGAINGIVSGRLSTGLHLGLIRPSFRKNTDAYMVLASSTLLASVSSGAAIGVLVGALCAAYYPDVAFHTVLLTCVTIQGLSFLVTFPLTSAICFLGYKVGGNPDVFLYPISSTLADISSSAIYALTAVALSLQTGTLLIASTAVLLTALSTASAAVMVRNWEYRKTLAEVIPTVMAVSLVGLLSGLALTSMRRSVERHPSIVFVYPALIDTLGDAGSIVGSTITTKLALGTTEPSLAEVMRERGVMADVGSASTAMYAIYGVISAAMGGRLRGLIVVLLCQAVAFPVVVLFSSATAIATHLKGLNPDNFVIPLETSITDLTVTVLLSVFCNLLLTV